ncbi:TolC family protein [Olivibacter ginsenosidimutans]
MDTLKKFFLTFIYIIPLFVHGQDSTKTHYTLEECIALALKNNADAQKSASSTSLAKVDLNQAKARLLPTIDGYLSHGINTGLVTDPITNTNISQNISSGSQQLSASLTLFNGLNRLRTIRQQAYAYEAYQNDEQRVKDNLTMDVILAYLQVITARDILEQTKQQRDVTQKQVERLTTLNNDGAADPGEFYDMQGQYSGDQLAVLTAANTLKSNIVILTQLLNIPYADELSFEAIDQIPSASTDMMDSETLYQHAATSLGILKAAELSKKSAIYGLKATRSLYFPTLSLGAGLDSRYSNSTTGRGTYWDQVQDNLGKGASLTLSIPILGGLQRRMDVARAKIYLHNAEIDLENAKNNLQQQSAQVLFNLQTAKEKYQEQQKQVEAYKESFRIAEVQFEAGAINSVEYLQQKNKYDQANIGLTVTQYEWQLRQRIANYYNGDR